MKDASMANLTKRKLIGLGMGALTALLMGCGGGGGGYDTPSTPPGPTTLGVVDDVVGAGVSVTASDILTVDYTLWLYSATALDHKGAQLQTSVGGTPFVFQIGLTPPKVIAGWEQGLLGMKAGGTRTLIVPSSLAYGSSGSTDGTIPPNTPLVFTVVLKRVQE